MLIRLLPCWRNRLTTRVQVAYLKMLSRPHCGCAHRMWNTRNTSLYSRCVVPSIRRHYSSRDQTRPPSSARLLSRAYLSFIGAGIGMLIWARLRYRSRRAKVSDGDMFEMYDDPHMNRNAGSMTNYKGTWIPVSLYMSNSNFEAIEDLPVNHNDIFVVSFPKSGTTWVQEIVYLIQNHVDLKKAQQSNIEARFPYLEYVYPGLRFIEASPSPRLIKTHLPYHLLPAQLRKGTGKMIYIARNPKDVCVSYYHFVRMLTIANYRGTFKNFFDQFVKGKVNYGPWWDHVASFWHQRDNKNVLFITYEELQKDPEGAVDKLANFLGKTLSNSQIEQICNHCSFNSMKANPATNYSWWDDLGLRKKGETTFMRKGVVGDWKNYITAEMSQELDVICQEKLEPIGLQFTDSL